MLNIIPVCLFKEMAQCRVLSEVTRSLINHMYDENKNNAAVKYEILFLAVACFHVHPSVSSSAKTL